MARNSLKQEPIGCPACGTKIRADRQRCPRCRAVLTKPDEAAARRQSLFLMKVTLAGVAVFVLVITTLWATGPESDAAVPVPRSAAGPAGSAAAPTADAPSTAESALGRPATNGFLDASGAGALAYSAGDYAGSLEQYQAAINRNPQDAESLSNLGQVLVRTGRIEEAVPYFERAIAIIPDRWAYRFNRARALGLLGKWDDAITEYRTAQELFPGDYATTFNLALALHKKGDDASAVPEYLKAIELAPDDGSFRFALALSYERLQKPAEAALAYQEYLRLSPEAADADRVRARISRLTSPDSSTPGSVDR